MTESPEHKRAVLAAEFYDLCLANTESFEGLSDVYLSLTIYLMGAILKGDKIEIEPMNREHLAFLDWVMTFDGFERFDPFIVTSVPMPSEIRAFSCYWDESYSGGPHHEIHHRLSFFSEDRGYSKKDIVDIYGLGVGEVYINHDHGLNSHIVTRVA